MTTNVQLLLETELEFKGGKFASRDEIVEELQNQFSDPGNLTVNEGEYDVINFEVTEYVAPDLKAAKRQRDAVLDAIGYLEMITNLSGPKQAAKLRKAFNLPKPSAAEEQPQERGLPHTNQPTEKE